MADEKARTSAAATGARELTGVNVPPAQTWNRLRANGITLSVPERPRGGGVCFSLPRLLEGIECGMGPEVSAWAGSEAGDASYVEVPARSVRTEPVVVAVDAATGDVRDTGVMVREGAEATIVVAVLAGGAPGTTTGSVLRVWAERGARVSVVEVLASSEGSQHLDSVGIHVDADARVDVRQYALGGGTVALGLACDLAGDRSRLDLTCRYFAEGSEVVDVNHVVRMRGRGTRAEVAESGVLDGAARKTLRATIDLVHGADGARGNEAENVLVLGDDVVNKTMPVILCDEDDVAGNHGATIGSVSPEQLSYLEGRGLGRERANQLFVRALFEDAIMHAPEARSHDAAVRRAEGVLGAEVAHDFDEGGMA